MDKLVNFKHQIRLEAITTASMHFTANIILMFEGFLAEDLQYKDLLFSRDVARSDVSRKI